MAKKTNERHGKHDKHFRTLNKGSKSTKKSTAESTAESKKSTSKKSAAKKSTSKKSTAKKSSAKSSQEKQETPAQAGYKTTLILVGAIIAVIAVILLAGKLFDGVDSEPPMQTDEGVLVASVNDESIYSDEIEKRMNYYQAQYGPSFSEEMVINQTINEVLLMQKAEEMGLSVNQGEIDNSVNEWLNQLRQKVSDKQLEQLLNQRNLTMEEYVQDLRDSIKRKLLIQKLLNETVLSELDTEEGAENLTYEDAREAYEENPGKYNQVKVSHILVCHKGAEQCESNRTKEEAKQLAEEVYQKVLAEPGSFAALAKNYSDGPSASKGGELNAFTKQSQMDENFKEAAFGLKKNQFTEPVETAMGYHIIKLLEKKDSFEELKQNILMQMQFQQQAKQKQQQQKEQQQAIQEYINKLKENADIEYHRKELKEGTEPKPSIQTFNTQKGEVCTEDGKPVVYLFTSSTCPHCNWVGDAFDSVAEKYMEQGQIEAYHWQMDSKDNLLTDKKEQSVPTEHKQVFREFSTGGVPTFVFGCKYYRVGNGYEGESNGLVKEKQEFEAVINELVS